MPGYANMFSTNSVPAISEWTRSEEMDTTGIRAFLRPCLKKTVRSSRPLALAAWM